MEYYADWEDERLISAQRTKFAETFKDEYERFVVDLSSDERLSFQDRALKRVKRSSKTELERFLAGPTCDDVSILEWWRLNAKSFPALARMVRDYMAIQVMFVFSTAFNYQRRSSLRFAYRVPQFLPKEDSLPARR